MSTLRKRRNLIRWVRYGLRIDRDSKTGTWPDQAGTAHRGFDKALHTYARAPKPGRRARAGCL